MIGEITSLEKIKISAHLAVQLSKPLSANPYPVTHAAHGVWEKYYCSFSKIESGATRVCECAA